RAARPSSARTRRACRRASPRALPFASHRLIHLRWATSLPAGGLQQEFEIRPALALSQAEFRGEPQHQRARRVELRIVGANFEFGVAADLLNLIETDLHVKPFAGELEDAPAFAHDGGRPEAK